MRDEVYTYNYSKAISPKINDYDWKYERNGWTPLP